MRSNPTERFSNRIENYVKYRPGYPAAIIDLLAILNSGRCLARNCGRRVLQTANISIMRGLRDACCRHRMRRWPDTLTTSRCSTT